MAEIADSDYFESSSPSPLSSSPTPFVARPISNVSTASDDESLYHPHVPARITPNPVYDSLSLPSQTASEATSSSPSHPLNPPPESDDHLDWPIDLSESDLPDYPYDNYSVASSEESLFVGNLDRGSDISSANYLEIDMDEDNSDNQIDELVGMEMELEDLFNQRQPRQPPRAEPEVIDLTGDVSSPQAAPARNMRRRRSQRNSHPPLERSDASYVGERTVIDLVSDSDEDAAVVPPLRNNERPRPPRRPYNIPPLQDMAPGIDMANLAGFEPLPQANVDRRQQMSNAERVHRLVHIPLPLFRFFGGPRALGGGDDDLTLIGHRNILPADNPIRDRQLPPFPPIQLNYDVHPFQNPPQMPGGGTPKPAHEPPKDTREGFTRNTADDVIAICPSCEQELAYEDGDDNSGTSSKKTRSKKDKAEHHFWAVKACGHVYCRKCFDNRKPVGKTPVPVGFRPEPSGAKNKMLCAVEDCESEVSAKAAWVGIFM